MSVKVSSNNKMQTYALEEILGGLVDTVEVSHVECCMNDKHVRGVSDGAG